MKLSVIIVNYNVKYFLEVCLHSVSRAAKGIAAEIIVVDNNSKDDSCNMVKTQFPDVVLLENKDNQGFSKANNQAVAIARGEYILFLNPDTVMPEDFFTQTLGYMDAHPKAGALGPRLIDGKGQFAPDAKKSFPTLQVALFKTIGINKLFSKSPYFNKYYAVHVGEHEIAPVEVLSGCCMLVRSSVIAEVGGAFDEDYFMYCEDVDLSYRIQKAGYENVYYPPATLIHYKGESTRKATLSYVRIFNEALIIFVKKHYSKKQASLYLLFINVGIVLRAVLGALRRALKILRMPLFDALILLGTLWLITSFWVLQVKNMLPIPFSSLYATLPVYTVLWIVTLYFNGAYDQPYRALRVTRGMVVGTIVILAYYGLLQPGLRYSRAIIIFSGFVGTVLLLGLHDILHRLGIFKYIAYDKLPRKAVIVADETHYRQTAHTLQRVHYAPQVAGRINPYIQQHDALGSTAEMKNLLYTANINEVIFCINGLSYADVFAQMQTCGARYDYKIHLPGSQSFVGSNSSHTAGDLYTVDRRYNLDSFAQMRNKRMIDLVSSVLFLVLLPVTAFMVKKPMSFIENCLLVMVGKRTWTGYALHPYNAYLPRIRKNILPPYNIIAGYTPGEEVKNQLNIAYAQHYTAGMEVTLMLNNFKYLGE
ncbi:MAG: glycosyltransferase [Flavipsychrobacter sp.]|nr:glycosyltransferase [Flavipsychrobacter sp.]